MVLIIAGAVLIFGLLIFVHELGHFAAAKSVGIRVNEFAMGMGPVLLKIQKGETQYALRLLPIGGFVRMEGEDEESGDERSFGKKPAWARAIVVVAGSTMNYLTAVVLVFVLLVSAGVAVNSVAEVQEGYPAAIAGMQPGDTIVEIDGQPVSSWQNVLDYVSGGTGDQIHFLVQRTDVAGTVQEIEIVTDVGKEAETGRRIVGITPQTRPDVGQSITRSFTGTVGMMGEMLSYIGQLFTGKGSVDSLVGPVGITVLVSDSAKLGWEYVVNLTAVISLNLAIVNMLPLPALDGGRLLFMIIEGITGRKVSEEIEGRIHFAGFVLLMALMLFITVKDVNTFILK